MISDTAKQCILETFSFRLLNSEIGNDRFYGKT